MKRVISLTLVVLLIASLFVGCGSDSPAGTYSIKSIGGKSLKDYFGAMAEESGLDVNALLALVGIDLDHPEDLMSITLKDDGTVAVKSAMEGEGDAQESQGTWKMEGDKLLITVDGDTQEFSYKNGEITAEMDGQVMVLGK